VARSEEVRILVTGRSKHSTGRFDLLEYIIYNKEAQEITDLVWRNCREDSGDLTLRISNRLRTLVCCEAPSKAVAMGAQLVNGRWQ
jgi:hypothetical protein